MMNWLPDGGVPGPLGPGEIVVWRVAGIADARRSVALEPLLSQDERERAQATAHPDIRAAFMVTRGTLRRILARHLGTDPAALRFDYGPTGKPSLRGGPVEFSVTHTAEGALIALADGRVGVDLERVRERPRMAQILDRLFAPATRLALRALPAPERLHAFHAAWTQREAYVKAVGGGIFSTPDLLPFVHPGAAAELVSEHGSGETWTVVPLQPWPSHCSAVVAHGAAEQIRLFDASALDG
ncbi:MAG TPA: 4'-phosphopantetheinyl transferase superfamily protein [Longimicrobiales bacterium]|nr:4'-phosphopantetheinyl transferase superfamily protein [Longimicrobiales bacterium]